jgi:AraC-like DNA-binding protein
MDPLSDVLSLLRPRNYMSAGFDAAGDWSIHFPDQQDSIKCGAVVSGRCWLAVEGAADPVLLEAGDSFLLPGGRPFRFASDLRLPSVSASSIFASVREGGLVTHNGGGDCLMLSSRFALAGNLAGVLLGALPPIVHLRSEAGQATLRWPVERMMQELREPRPGGFLVIQHLAHMVLVQALRLHMANGAGGGVGWLSALGDRQVGAAITAMHGDPAHRWTLQALADHAGMSRSTFALRFKEAVGKAPMDYLTRWRMLLAGDRLAHSRDAISAISLSLGYESESAFATAFKRVMGCSPRQYGRAFQAASIAPDDGEERAEGNQEAAPAVSA